MHRLIGLILVVVVAASACGSGTDDSENAADGSGLVVESADGMATLLLPEGSLPPDVSVGDVTLEVIVDDDAVPGAPVVAVQLLPGGLVLSQAAELTVALPEALDGGFMAIHQSGDTFEFLDGVIEWQDDVPSFTTSITHFSVVTLNSFEFASSSLDLTRSRVSKGETQQADVILERCGALVLAQV